MTNANKNISTRITQLEGSIDSKVADGIKGVSSQITQLTNSIDLKVSQGLKSLNGQEIVSRINLSPEGTRIDGKLLHVTGKAKFDDNIITSKMLQASAVTADKIKVDSLSSITANVGTLTGGTITGSTIIGTTIQNASGTFSVSSEGVIKGATIDAQSFRKSGFEITALKVETYNLRNKAPLPVPEGFSFEECRYIVLNIDKWEVVYESDKPYWESDRHVNDPGAPKQDEIWMVGSQHDTKRIGWQKHHDSKTDITVIKCGITKNRKIFAFEVYEKYSWGQFREGFLNVMCIATKGW